jgi:hypothetical protein
MLKLTYRYKVDGEDFMASKRRRQQQNYVWKELKRENLNLMKHQNANNSVARTSMSEVKLHSPYIHARVSLRDGF